MSISTTLLSISTTLNSISTTKILVVKSLPRLKNKGPGVTLYSYSPMVTRYTGSPGNQVYYLAPNGESELRKKYLRKSL